MMDNLYILIDYKNHTKSDIPIDIYYHVHKNKIDRNKYVN